MILFLIFMFSVSQAQRIVYNTTHCKDDSLLFNSTNVLPHSPAYAMSISSSTYQANKPITIDVRACHKHGIRAFLLKASIQGYVPVSSFDPLTQLGTILVSCGVRELRQNRIQYNNNPSLELMKFRWIPPQSAHGNITFHFTAIPTVPSIYWLTFSSNYQLGDETYISVQQKCSADGRLLYSITTFTAAVVLVIAQHVF
ncbi:uncharacterized protein LOC130654794 [Hydractinia symbiolongicarpus]|uniref:uncharacterized protein LOC130654794 n=1 Tax=Hydractinia symbiolongicarpus TaxID=13093 RepID=UPI00254B1DE4|nr:uncharacterized protein LOC130654794 [Hydractinia symbiolongicarpus]